MQDVLDEIAQLESRKQELIGKVHDTAFGNAESAVDELNQLGFDYVIIEESELPKSKRKPKIAGPCSICGFETDPPHDARAHRSQGKNKRPFTDEELAEKNMTRVEAAPQQNKENENEES